ncbi:alpha-1,2-mannosidase, putative [Pedobacter nyackensis]|uniref:Alpha-1,2-mannosidase, putative n=2 Tax=Pedobacter nyackensis TaxID=475255 RepID=A0A1W2F2D4_9SPHI|nr:alpha-1,2-mannosidase, putative [Pedobacter nyackensis]
MLINDLYLRLQLNPSFVMNQFSKRLIVTAIIGTTACFVNAQSKSDLYKYVKPIIGTQKMGHTYPGATVPFGMVQLSPDTDTLSYEDNGKYNKDVYRYCAGYQYDDPTIVGFSHTHYSGTGHSDLGDFLVMPTVGKVQLNPGTATQPESGYRSKYSHQNEVAEANYYKVKLDDDGVLAELTTSASVGFHQYTFPKSKEANIILDLMHGIYNYDNKNVWTYVRVVNDSLVTGYRQTNGWAKNRKVYFAMSFSKPFKSYGAKDFTKKEVYKGFWAKFDQTRNFPEMAARQIRMYFNFDTEEAEKVKIKFAISSVSSDNALMNMQAEIPGWDFNQVKQQGQQLWNKELQKIEVKTKKTEDAINFYTAMYHAFLSPTVYMDVNNQYMGLDQKVHEAKGFKNYTTFSLWDTYRTLHPFFNIVQPQRNSDMVKSMLAHFDQSALPMLPVWSNSANDTWCMSGYHSVSVIADAIIKGNFNGDINKALAACVATANQRNYEGIGDYIDKGYVPSDKNRTAVSNTLEYAYDDWCIAQLAKKAGNTEVYNTFIKRSENWRNVYDTSIGFMRPRLSDGTFRKNFDVLETEGQGFIEGNAWNYSLYVPQNPGALIQTMGGDKKFIPHLDSLFTMDLPDAFFAHTEDITREGIIGNYVHGNEPAHHVAYLYNYTSQPWKTQKTVRMILGKQYHNGPDGLGGNDDCGQMSAWYILSSLGFYPMAPASDRYDLGSPAVLNATINLENGKQFIVEAKNQSDKNVYVKQVLLNGKVLDRLYIIHSEITDGGQLTFVMASVPNKKSR